MGIEFDGLLFANLIDFDMVYGHGNDTYGYARALEVFDNALNDIFALVRDDNLLIVTADHRCDHTTKGTDHIREYVPGLIRLASVKYKELDIVNMSDIAATIVKHHNIEYNLS